MGVGGINVHVILSNTNKEVEPISNPTTHFKETRYKNNIDLENNNDFSVSIEMNTSYIDNIYSQCFKKEIKKYYKQLVTLFYTINLKMTKLCYGYKTILY